jgi:hypothetical protein
MKCTSSQSASEGGGSRLSPARHPCQTNAVADDVSELAIAQILGVRGGHVGSLGEHSTAHRSVSSAVIPVARGTVVCPVCTRGGEKVVATLERIDEPLRISRNGETAHRSGDHGLQVCRRSVGTDSRSNLQPHDDSQRDHPDGDRDRDEDTDLSAHGTEEVRSSHQAFPGCGSPERQPEEGRLSAPLPRSVMLLVIFLFRLRLLFHHRAVRHLPVHSHHCVAHVRAHVLHHLRHHRAHPFMHRPAL